MRSISVGVVRAALAALCLLALAASSPLQAQDNPKPSGELTLATERVVVFKDGYALFVKKAQGTVAADGSVFTHQVPDSQVLGCTFATTADAKTLPMRAEWIETTQVVALKTVCLTMVELLRANQGTRLTLVRQDGAEVTGVVKEVLELPPVQAAQGAPVGGEFVVIDATTGGRIVLPIRDVRDLKGPDVTTRMVRRTRVTTRRKRLTFDFGRERAGEQVTLTLMYFAPGVRWIPTYRVQLSDEDTAEMALQAEVLNEAEDIREAAVDLVVGVPNFRFKSVISPLALESALRRTLQRAAPGLMGQSAFSNALHTQRSGEYRRGSQGGGNMAMAPELAGESQQDLFVYPVKQFSLNKGARATVPLWQKHVPYRHVYTMRLHVTRNARTGSAQGQSPAGQSPLRLAKNEVWHQLELKNDSQVPWTTGAALILDEGLPLAQELLTYTSIGGSTLLPVTVAVDLRGSYAEIEVDRRANALQWGGHGYAQIRKRGTISLTNYRAASATLRVSLSVGGRVESASDLGVVLTNDYREDDWTSRYSGVNNHSDVRWELELKPGETKTLKATFYFYTP